MPSDLHAPADMIGDDIAMLRANGERTSAHEFVKLLYPDGRIDQPAGIAHVRAGEPAHLLQAYLLRPTCSKSQ
jgi:hypothetical protein